MMKKIKFPIFLLIVFLTISGFLFQRYKTKRIDALLGANKTKIEELYKATGYLEEEVNPEHLEEEIQELIKEEKIRPKGKVLRLTINGSVRKQILWLADEGDGYYVIEALDSMR